jgi:AcrR family transcriptional regulator
MWRALQEGLVTIDSAARDRLLAAMSAHVLDHGLTAASLRPLAKAAGTSDRMLIYYFGSKAALIDAVLVRLSHDLAQALGESMPHQRARSFRECATEIMALLRSRRFKPYMRVWLEIVAAAARGDKASGTTAAAILAGFIPWLAGRLPADEPDPQQRARMLLTLIEGALVMDSCGMSEVADQAIAMA